MIRQWRPTSFATLSSDGSLVMIFLVCVVGPPPLPGLITCRLIFVDWTTQGNYWSWRHYMTKKSYKHRQIYVWGNFTDLQNYYRRTRRVHNHSWYWRSVVESCDHGCFESGEPSSLSLSLNRVYYLTKKSNPPLTCLLWIKKVRGTVKTYIWVSVWWKTKKSPLVRCCLL